MYWRWFAHLMGWDSVTDSEYAFSSGSGWLLIAWLVSMVAWWWRTSCKAVWWCPGHGVHDFTDPQTGAAHRLCWYHNPNVASKHLGVSRIKELQKEYRLYLGDKPGRG